MPAIPPGNARQKWSKLEPAHQQAPPDSAEETSGIRCFRASRVGPIIQSTVSSVARLASVEDALA